MSDNKLFKLYEHILGYCGMSPKDNGEIRITLLDSDHPTIIDGKQLYMPYPEILKSLDAEKQIVFHPFQEYVNRGESPVVRKLRRCLNVRINLAILGLADELFKILSNPALHSKLNPQQRELLRAVSEVTPTTRAQFAGHFAQMVGEAPESIILNIYLKKSGTFKGEKHARVGVVSFPGYEHLKEKPSKITKSDWKAFREILEFIFPGSSDDAEAYNGFSDSTDAPWLDCLLKTSYNITSRLNELYALYKEFIVEPKDIMVFSDDWIDELDNLQHYRKEILLIPSQKGNEGDIENPVLREQTTSAVAAINREPVRPTPAPAPVVQQPVQVQQPPQYQPQFQPPQYQQPMQPPQPQLAKTSDGKLDFNSILATNPMAAMSPGMPSPILAKAEMDRMMAMQAAMMQSPTMVGMQPGMYPPGYPGAYGMYPAASPSPTMMSVQASSGMMPPGMPGMPGMVQQPPSIFNGYVQPVDPRMVQQPQQFGGYPPGNYFPVANV